MTGGDARHPARRPAAPGRAPRASLRTWVLRRSGVPLGAPGSLRNMLARSLGAASFAGFWRHWNPVWGYALATRVYRPARRRLPRAGAVLLTFAASGLAHDLVIIAVRRSFALVFTPWFLLVSLGVLVGERAKMDLSRWPWAARAAAHVGFIGSCFWVVRRFAG